MTALQVGRQTSRWNLETQKRGKGGPPTGMEGLTQGRNLNLAVWLSPPPKQRERRCPELRPQPSCEQHQEWKKHESPLPSAARPASGLWSGPFLQSHGLGKGVGGGPADPALYIRGVGVK